MNKTYYSPHKLYRVYNPELLSFICYYGSRTVRVRAEGRYEAREKASKYFGAASNKIVAVRA
jgi:hypothetical protein